MLQRTAADIVGVPNKKVIVQPVYIFIIKAFRFEPFRYKSIHFNSNRII